jgi:hypothetical protein
VVYLDALAVGSPAAQSILARDLEGLFDQLIRPGQRFLRRPSS